MKAAYGANYDGSLALKGKYDPTNLFRLNQNIRPPSQAASDATRWPGSMIHDAAF